MTKPLFSQKNHHSLSQSTSSWTLRGIVTAFGLILALFLSILHLTIAPPIKVAVAAVGGGSGISTTAVVVVGNDTKKMKTTIGRQFQWKRWDMNWYIKEAHSLTISHRYYGRARTFHHQRLFLIHSWLYTWIVQTRVTFVGSVSITQWLCLRLFIICNQRQ